jgi:L-amino acid N-acyltransferase YncA
MRMRVRDASAADAASCAAIYAPFVGETAITFESDPPSPAEMSQRIARASERHAWLVAERDGEVVGYAYGSTLNPRTAYRWSCEVSVYVEREQQRIGAGRALYEALLGRLGERGYCMAVAGMTLPNEASVGLHVAMGFEPIGTFRSIGYKLGAWHDVAWVQRPLVDAPASPREPA